METAARLEDEEGDGDSGTHGRRVGEHHVEHGKVNPRVVMARAEEHGWQGTPATKTFGGRWRLGENQ